MANKERFDGKSEKCVYDCCFTSAQISKQLTEIIAVMESDKTLYLFTDSGGFLKKERKKRRTFCSLSHR